MESGQGEQPPKPQPKNGEKTTPKPPSKQTRRDALIKEDSRIQSVAEREQRLGAEELESLKTLQKEKGDPDPNLNPDKDTKQNQSG